MDTHENNLVEADLKAVMDHVMGLKPLDPEIASRVRDRSDRATAELRRMYSEMKRRRQSRKPR